MSAEQEACLGVTLDQGPRYLPLARLRENANNYANRCNTRCGTCTTHPALHELCDSMKLTTYCW
jgi:hypothetical protein